NDLLPLLLLGGLLDPGVEIADRWRGRLNGLSVELQHEPQHAVRTGVLRPHVDGHRLGAEFGHQTDLSTTSRCCSHWRATRSLSTFARNCSSVTCNGSVVLAGSLICTG